MRPLPAALVLLALSVSAPGVVSLAAQTPSATPPVTLTPQQAIAVRRPGDLQWSPDGTRLVFTIDEPASGLGAPNAPLGVRPTRPGCPAVHELREDRTPSTLVARRHSAGLPVRSRRPRADLPAEQRRRRGVGPHKGQARGRGLRVVARWTIDRLPRARGEDRTTTRRRTRTKTTRASSTRTTGRRTSGRWTSAPPPWRPNA